MARLRKSFATLLASIRLIPGVLRFVHAQPVLVPECLSTECACKRLLVIVGQQVAFEVYALGEAPITLWACVRLYPIMQHHVPLDVLQAPECLTTALTGVRL